MSEPEGRLSLDTAAVRSIAAAHGIALEDEEADRVLRQAWPAVARLRDLAEGLCADDDIHAFRRHLVREAAGG